MRFATAVFLILASAVVNAQSIGGPRTYPQFRDMAGLSGNGFPVKRTGELGLAGALSLSTPIGYVLSTKQLVLGASSRSFDRSFRWVNTSFASNQEKSDGTLQGIFSLDSLGSRIAITHMIVSPANDSVQHLQYQLRLPESKTNNWTFSIGCHNVTDRPAANGDDNPVEDSRLSRSFFVVGTQELPEDAYLTVGLGDTRYRGLFGSYSKMLNSQWRAYGEFDTFNWNFGALTELRLLGKQAFLQMGLVRGDLATWSLNWVF